MAKAQKAWRAAGYLRARNVATPLTQALVWRRKTLLHSEYILITRGLTDGKSLLETLGDQAAPSPGAKAAIIDSVATFLARLHRLGVYHGDLSALNLIVQPTQQRPARYGIHLIDLDAIRSLRWISRRRRVKNLDELGRNFLDLAMVGNFDRLRFLHIYYDAYGCESRSLDWLRRAVCRRTRQRLNKYGFTFLDRIPSSLGESSEP
jgi:hypothetical protein